MRNFDFRLKRNCVLQQGHFAPSYDKYTLHDVHLLVLSVYLFFSARCLSQIPLHVMLNLHCI